MNPRAALLAACWLPAAGWAVEGRVLGYYPSWVGDTYPPSAVEFGLFTHVCHAFLTASPDGSVVAEGTVPSRDLTARGRQAGVQVLLTVGGADSGAWFNPLGRSAAARKRFVEQAVAAAADNGYDGLDVDWEFPENAEDRADLARVVRALRKALAARGKAAGRTYLLTAALPNGPYYGQWYDAAALEDACDFLNVMTYDYSGPWRRIAGHNAPFERPAGDPESGSVRETLSYWWKDRQIGRRKLTVGIPAYGRGFDARAPYDRVREGDRPERVAELDYREVPALIEAGWTRSRDGSAGGVPWLLAPDRKRVLGYDDPESAAAKAAWAQARGFGGIFFWEINADRMPDGSHPLVESAVRGWRSAAAAAEMKAGVPTRTPRPGR